MSFEKELLYTKVAKTSEDQKKVLDRANDMGQKTDVDSIKNEAMSIYKTNRDLGERINTLKKEAEELDGYQTDIFNKIKLIEDDNEAVQELIRYYLNNMSSANNIANDISEEAIDVTEEENEELVGVGINEIGIQEVEDAAEVDENKWFEENKSNIVSAVDRLLNGNGIIKSANRDIKIIAAFLMTLKKEDAEKKMKACSEIMKNISRLMVEKPEIYELVKEERSKLEKGIKEMVDYDCEFLEGIFGVDFRKSLTNEEIKNVGQVIGKKFDSEIRPMMKDEFNHNNIRKEITKDEFIKDIGLMIKYKRDGVRAFNSKAEYVTHGYFKAFENKFKEISNNQETVETDPFKILQNLIDKGYSL